MKVLRVQNGSLSAKKDSTPDGESWAEFAMAEEEQILLWHLLQQYPLVPPRHQRLSNSAENQEENEQLLEEALQEQRTANRMQIMALLNEAGRFQAVPDSEDLHVTFSFAEIDWLLQICNAVRVGSWLALGSPDLDARPDLKEKPAMARHYFNMEIAGVFEAQFIRALNGDFTTNDEEVE
jgi:hypothetical protein